MVGIYLGVAQAVGLPFVRPYLAGNCAEDFRYAANFAVGGATALDNQFFRSMGLQIIWTNYSLGAQLEWFRQLLPSLCSSDSDCGTLMGNSLFLVGEIGGNDYNHPLLQGRSVDEIKTFVPNVVGAISSAISELIQLGAKTMIVPGDLPLGCVPAFLEHFSGAIAGDYEAETGCLKFLNRLAEYHNQMLSRELSQLRRSHPHPTIIYADYYNATVSIYRSPRRYGEPSSSSTLDRCAAFDRVELDAPQDSTEAPWWRAAATAVGITTTQMHCAGKRRRRRRWRCAATHPVMSAGTGFT
ncbi:lipid catabolic process [Musa troglodytarum]|uniref:Lipid catabolic process n=1 Tax=Musa troglodytarum TaxID=320322 RepID=A0A9E7JCT7_9LILI|nr:lipid catabolic process [Musa troglodytarum]